LLNKKADPNLKNAQQETAFRMAMAKHNTQIAELLKLAGAKE